MAEEKEGGEDLPSRFLEVFRRFSRVKARFATPDPVLRPSERLMLITLAGPQAAEGLRSSALSACHEVSPGAATQLVDALVKAGLAERIADPRDRRSVIVRITPAGRTYYEQSMEKVRALTRAVVDWLGEEDSRALIRILERLEDFRGVADPAEDAGSKGRN